MSDQQTAAVPTWPDILYTEADGHLQADTLDGGGKRYALKMSIVDWAPHEFDNAKELLKNVLAAKLGD